MTQSAVHSEISLAQNDALFLDFDGTLVPIQDDPDTVVLASDMRPVLLSISKRLCGALAIISGRGLFDLTTRVPIDLWRFGNHGLFNAKPGVTPPTASPSTPADLLQKINAVCAKIEGVWVELKGPVIAIHYRAAQAYSDTLGKALNEIVAPIDGYKLQQGKCVYEAKPIGANKGKSLSNTMSRAPFSGRRPVMFGDDTTDEDAFTAANALGGISIKVGEGATEANYRLADVASVHEILKEFECRLRG